jgi:hypothetical protein
LRFSSLQVTLLLTGGAEGKRRRSRAGSNWCSGLSAAARGSTRRQWRRRVGQTRRHCFRLAEGHPCNFRLFWG